MVVDHGGMCPLWVDVARQLVDGLIYMHHMGVSHNDLKPANVFYTMKVSTAQPNAPLGSHLDSPHFESRARSATACSQTSDTPRS